LRAGFMKNAPLGLAVAVLLFIELFAGLIALSHGVITLGVSDGASTPMPGASNIEAIGALLYSRYLFQFEAAGLILLVAMVGAIVLTHRKRGGVRIQNISQQVARRPDEATVNTKPDVGAGVRL
jgi:NADH-quinone oxidoreductase subunit J